MEPLLKKSVTENVPSHSCHLTPSNQRNIKVFKGPIESGEYPLRLRLTGITSALALSCLEKPMAHSAHNPTASKQNKTKHDMTRIQDEFKRLLRCQIPSNPEHGTFHKTRRPQRMPASKLPTATPSEAGSPRWASPQGNKLVRHRLTDKLLDWQLRQDCGDATRVPSAIKRQSHPFG
jgi:hypothetical protein